MSAQAKLPAHHCSNCNGDLPIHSNDDYFYGSPIRTCPHCGKQYLDRHYHEAEIEGFQETDVSGKAAMKEVSAYAGILLILLILNLLSLYSGRIRPVLIILFIAAIVLLLSALKKSMKVLTGLRKRELEKELQLSVKRLEDRDYAHLLKELGYQVPEKYL